MARNNNFITTGLQGNLLGLTFVNSRTHPKHVRAKRGTYKEAVLNESMLESKERLVNANGTAKLIFDAIRDDHKDGSLWSRLLSEVRQQMKSGIDPDVRFLDELECSMTTPLNKILPQQVYHVAISVTDYKLNVAIDLHTHPKWRKVKYIKCYQPVITVLFPDFVNGRIEKNVIPGAVTPLSGEPATISAEVAIPSGATGYVVFLMVTGGDMDGIINRPHLKAMRVVKTGKL